MIDMPTQLREMAVKAQRAKHAYTPLIDAANTIEDLAARLNTAQAQLLFRNSHPFHPAQDLDQARQYARFFACPAPGCRAVKWESCPTIDMKDHDARLTLWLSNGRPLGQ